MPVNLKSVHLERTQDFPWPGSVFVCPADGTEQYLDEDNITKLYKPAYIIEYLDTRERYEIRPAEPEPFANLGNTGRFYINGRKVAVFIVDYEHARAAELGLAGYLAGGSENASELLTDPETGQIIKLSRKDSDVLDIYLNRNKERFKITVVIPVNHPTPPEKPGKTPSNPPPGPRP